MRLEPGEQVVVRTHRHPRALLGAASALVATAFLLGLARGHEAHVGSGGRGVHVHDHGGRRGGGQTARPP